MAKRRSLGAPRTTHALRAGKLWNVIEDHAVNARDAVKRGDCMNALNHLEKAFESSGESLAENLHGKFYDPKREEEIEELLFNADLDFKSGCLRPQWEKLKSGGSMRGLDADVRLDRRRRVDYTVERFDPYKLVEKLGGTTQPGSSWTLAFFPTYEAAVEFSEITHGRDGWETNGPGHGEGDKGRVNFRREHRGF